MAVAMMRGCLVCLMLLVPTKALAFDDDQRAERRGFTAEYSLCVGLDRTSVLDLPTDWEQGGLLVNFSLGTFVNPDLAVGFRSSGLRTDVDRFGLGREIGMITELIGMYVASWHYAPFELMANAGVARLDSQAVITNDVTGERFLDEDFGWGIGLGAYAPLFGSGRHRIEFGLEWRTMMFDHEDVHQLSLHLGYQLF